MCGKSDEVGEVGEEGERGLGLRTWEGGRGGERNMWIHTLYVPHALDQLVCGSLTDPIPSHTRRS
jgi:hypothetical protein